MLINIRGIVFKSAQSRHFRSDPIIFCLRLGAMDCPLHDCLSKHMLRLWGQAVFSTVVYISLKKTHTYRQCWANVSVFQHANTTCSCCKERWKRSCCVVKMREANCAMFECLTPPPPLTQAVVSMQTPMGHTCGFLFCLAQCIECTFMETIHMVALYSFNFNVTHLSTLINLMSCFNL